MSDDYLYNDFDRRLINAMREKEAPLPPEQAQGPEWTNETHPTFNGICPECYSVGYEDAENTQARELRDLRAALEELKDFHKTNGLQQSGNGMVLIDGTFWDDDHPALYEWLLPKPVEARDEGVV